MPMVTGIRAFAELNERLSNTKIRHRRAFYLEEYLSSQNESDASRAIFFLLQKKIARTISTKELVTLAIAQLDLSDFAIQSSMDQCSDTIEAISLLLPDPPIESSISLEDIISGIRDCKQLDLGARNHYIIKKWAELAFESKILFNRLLTNTYRSPLSKFECLEYLSDIYDIPCATLSYHLHSQPQNHLFSYATLLDHSQLISPPIAPVSVTKAVEIQKSNDILPVKDHFVSAELNGIRVQLIRTKDTFHIWRSNGELLTQKLPEISSTKLNLPINSIFDGILIARNQDGLLPKEFVTKRLNKIRVSQRDTSEQPISFCAMDLLVHEGEDLSRLPYSKRRRKLNQIIEDVPHDSNIELLDEFVIDEENKIESHFNDLEILHSHALIFKHQHSNSLNEHGWFKLKSPSKKLSGVLLYVKRGEGVLSNQFIEFTVGAASGSTFVPIARINPALPDDLRLELYKFIKDNTLERFGPVLSLDARVVFELTYDGVQFSGRHKSGLKLINPRFSKWNKESTIEAVIQLNELQQQIPE